jgi:hypothetical protein
MPVLSSTTVIVATALLFEVALVITLVRKRLVFVYPVFVLYLLLNLIEDPLGMLLQGHAPRSYVHFYVAVTLLDYILQIFVLWEIARDVFRPTRGIIPIPVTRLTVVGILCCLVIATSFSGVHLFNTGSTEEVRVLLQIALPLAILKILLFACLAGFAQVLGIGWKNHALQLASGLAFFAAVSLLIQMSSSHVARGPNYLTHLGVLTEIQSGAYLSTLLFWIWAFSRNEAPRKDFTPQMQEVLVTIAESAKRTRLAVTRSSEPR